MYRDQLVSRTLCCVNDNADKTEAANISTGESSSPSRLTSGKIGKCARDMVAECRSCGVVVCRVRCYPGKDVS